MHTLITDSIYIYTHMYMYMCVCMCVCVCVCDRIEVTKLFTKLIHDCFTLNLPTEGK